MTNDEVDAAIATAHDRFSSWRRVATAQRATLLRRAAKLCRERCDDLASFMTIEMGKRITEGHHEIELCARIFEYYADHGELLLQPETILSPDGDATLLSEPLGVVFGIQPWNYPFYQVIRFAVPNLMAGNVVLLKHASNVQQCAEATEELFQDAGFLSGAYTNLVASSGLATRVIDDDRVRGVSFTGSDAGGARVAERTGRNVKKTVLELGGGDPFVVLDDADFDTTVDWAVWGRMNDMGQSCVASKRFIVLESIIEQFLERFGEKLAALKVGDPLDELTGVAPLCSVKAARDLEDQINRSVAAGAEIIIGGKRPDPEGAFLEPTILTNVKQGMPANDEELFGPVASMIAVPDEAKAIEVANHTKSGRGGSVDTRDVEYGRGVAEHIHSGMVFINFAVDTLKTSPSAEPRNPSTVAKAERSALGELLNKKVIRVHPNILIACELNNRTPFARSVFS